MVLDAFRFRASHLKLFRLLKREIEEKGEHRSPFIVCVTLVGGPGHPVVGYGMAWHRGKFYRRMLLPEFPPSRFREVKDAMSQLTSRQLERLFPGTRF